MTSDPAPPRRARDLDAARARDREARIAALHAEAEALPDTPEGRARREATLAALAALADTPEKRAWKEAERARWSAMNAYVAEVDQVANDPSMPRAVVVVCAACGRDQRGKLRTVAEVLAPTPLGPVLVTQRPADLVDRDTLEPMTAAQARARGAQPYRARGVRLGMTGVGWVVDGPHMWSARVGPWTHPDGRHAPEVRCPTHGPLVPSVEGLRVAVRSGWKLAGVGVDGLVTRV